MFLFLYLLGIVSSLFVFTMSKGAQWYDNTILELFLDVYVVCAVACVIPRVFYIGKKRPGRFSWHFDLRILFKALVYVVLYPLYIIDMFCFVKFGTTINPSMLLLMGETTSNEAGEFFASYVTPDLLLSPVGVMLLIPLLHVITAVLWQKYQLSIINCQLSINHRLMRIARWAGEAAVAALLVWSAFASYDNKALFSTTMSRETIGEVEHDFAIKPHTELYQPTMRLAFSIFSNQLIAKQLDRLYMQVGTVQVDSCDVKSPEIVLVIGESCNKRHFQLYGYDKNTTPNQVKMEQQRLLTKFDDVVSPWNLTSFVFKHFMTTYCVGDKNDWCDYPLFCEVFRKAGYKVSFFTNQFLPRAKEAVYDFSGGFFINDSTLSRAQFDVRNDELHIFDESLLQDYDREAQRPSTQPNLTIFHLMGQHVNYRVRCPKKMARWGADCYPDFNDIPERLRRIMSQYDNAVWYGDSVVNQIVERFKEKEAIIIFLSDHGEEVFGPGARQSFGRMHNARITKRLADEEFRVPMWIYTTPRYKQRHPDMVQAIRAAAKKPFMTDALSHLLFGVAGIHCPYYREEYDILSPQYNAKRPRLLKHSVDYNKLR